jgi:hypothetical protein
VSNLKSIPSPSFWKLYEGLPVEIRRLADKAVLDFQENLHHPSLGFARKGGVYTVEIGRSYRAIARYRDGAYYWFWIGSHEAYNKLLSRVRKG